MPKIGKIETSKTVTNEHEAFKGTDYEKDIFSLSMAIGIEGKIANEVGHAHAKEFWSDRLADGDVPSLVIGKFIILAMIKDWSGFKSEDGQDLECTRENKSMMYDSNSDFFDLVYFATVQKDKEETPLDDAMGKQSGTSDGNTPKAVEKVEKKTAKTAKSQSKKTEK